MIQTDVINGYAALYSCIRLLDTSTINNTINSAYGRNNQDQCPLINQYMNRSIYDRYDRYDPNNDDNKMKLCIN